MIVGLGLDIAEIDRIEAAIAPSRRCLSQARLHAARSAYCESHKNKFERYAARFAAKEAA